MTLRKFLQAGLATMASLLALTSCDTSDEYYYVYPYYANAVVTVKPVDGDAFYMQLDDRTTLYPANVERSPYGDKEVRALVNCYRVDADAHGYTSAVYVNWIDSFLTKRPVIAPTGHVDDIYGTDPIEIVKDWVTVAEDGYLTLRIRTLWGAGNKPHYINLLTGMNPDDPYEVELRHNAEGDTQGHWGDALVAFRLREWLVGGEQTITVKYRSFSGEKKVTFTFNEGSIASDNGEISRATYSDRVK